MAAGRSFADALSTRLYLVLDGALATELEKQGCDLASSSADGDSDGSSHCSNRHGSENHEHSIASGIPAPIPAISDASAAAEGLVGDVDLSRVDTSKLWSGKVLLESPERIYRVHRDYFAAGADVAITASYQASTQGLLDAGLSEAQAARLLHSSVTLAQRARDHADADAAADASAALTLVSDTAARSTTAPPVPTHRFIAGSIGPYGAYLANGAEYTGIYPDPASTSTSTSMSTAQLMAFHRPRMRALLAAGADVLACETLPNLAEVHALTQLLRELDAPAWLALTLRDAQHLSDGTPLVQVARVLECERGVLAVGVNCVAPGLVAEALRELRRECAKPLVVYPNSGEGYDAVRKCWVAAGEDGGSGVMDWEELVEEWYGLGARLIGGCCRTSPDDVRAIRKALDRICNTHDET